MRVTLTASSTQIRVGERVTFRLEAHNDGEEPVIIDHRLLVGPNVVPTFGGQPCPPWPLTFDAGFEEASYNQTVLKPGRFYGRDYVIDNFVAGGATVHAFLLKSSDGRIHPHGPENAELLEAAAEPVVVTIAP
jgi:hypothetical protein